SSARDELEEQNQELASRQTWYEVLRLALLAATAAALALAIALLTLLAKTHDADRRRRRAVERAELLQTSLDKYRQLGAQLELKYQSAFRQPASPAAIHEQTQVLRRAYEEESARLDALIEERQRKLETALGADAEPQKASPEREHRVPAS